MFPKPCSLFRSERMSRLPNNSWSHPAQVSSKVLDRVGGVVCAATSAYSRCPAFLTCCKLLGPFDPALLHAHARGKLVGEAQVQPELDCHANGEGVPCF